MEIAGQIYRACDIPARWLLIDGGLNDLLFDNAAPEALEADFRALFRRMGGRRRVIVTLMPYVADPAQSARIDAANGRLTQLCAERGYLVVDLNPMIAQDGARASDMNCDGLHFSRKAKDVWLDAVRGEIEKERGAA